MTVVSLLFSSCKEKEIETPDNPNDKETNAMTFTFSDANATDKSISFKVTPSDLNGDYFLGIMTSAEAETIDDATIILEADNSESFLKYKGEQTCVYDSLVPETDYAVLAFTCDNADEVSRFTITTLAQQGDDNGGDDNGGDDNGDDNNGDDDNGGDDNGDDEVKVYAPGDVYDVDGVIGVVFYVNETGTNGYIMSMDEAELQWSTEFVWANCISQKGEWNTEDMLKLGEDKYPAAKWCVDHGEGWYMPSSYEMNLMWDAVSDGKRVFDYEFVKLYNNKLQDPILEDYYWSSNETSEDMAEVVAFIDDSVICLDPMKNRTFNVRAIRKF